MDASGDAKHGSNKLDRTCGPRPLPLRGRTFRSISYFWTQPRGDSSPGRPTSVPLYPGFHTWRNVARLRSARRRRNTSDKEDDTPSQAKDRNREVATSADSRSTRRRRCLRKGSPHSHRGRVPGRRLSPRSSIPSCPGNCRSPDDVISLTHHARSAHAHGHIDQTT